MAAQTELERLVVRLIGDGSSFKQMLDTANQQLAHTSEQLRKVGDQMSKAITVPVLGMGTASVMAFKDFDQAMTETFAKLGRQTPQVRRRMEDVAKALSISGEVAFSPTELAKGYEELASAGLDAERSMAALPHLAKFAQAGAFDLAVGVKQLTGAMAAFGAMSKDPAIFTQNMIRFSDVIVGVANETTTGVEQVARAMAADAATAAKDYGMSLETLGAILGVYAQKNKDAEEAGNMTGRMLRLMTGAFVKNKSEWKKMGINITDANGRFIHFADAIQQLETALGRLSPEAQVEALNRLGIENLSQKALKPLIGMSDELRRQEAMYSKSGTTAEMAAIQMESFANQMKVVKNEITVAGIELGQILAPALKQVANGIRYTMQAWRRLGTGAQTIIVSMAGVAAAVGPALLALRFLGLGFLLTTAKATAIMAPLVLVITAAGWAVAIWVAKLGGVTEAFDKIQETIAPLMEKLQELWGNAVAWTKDFIKANRQVVDDIIIVSAAVLIGVAAFKLLNFTIGLTMAMMSALGITKIINIGIWLAWKAVLLTITATQVLFNAAWVVTDLVITAATAVAGAWTIGATGASAATAAWAAATAALNVAMAIFAGIALGTVIGLIAVGLIYVASAMYGALEVGRALLGLFNDYGTAGDQLDNVKDALDEWIPRLQAIYEIAKTDLPVAWELVKLAADVAVSQITDAWPPLWEMVSEGAKVVAESIATVFTLNFYKASERIKVSLLKALDVTGLATPFLEAGLQETIGKLDEAISGNVGAAGKHLEMLGRRFKVKESPATKAAKEALDEAIFWAEAEMEMAKWAAEDAAENDKKRQKGQENLNNEIAKGRREIERFDAALVGSAEAYARLEQWRDTMKMGGMAADKAANRNFDVAQSNTAEALARGDRQEDLLKKAVDNLDKLVKKPSADIAPAGIA